MTDRPETTDRPRKTVIVLHETFVQSVVRDAITYIMIIAVIGTGWWLGSDAMQWLGFVMLCLGAIGRATRTHDRLTPQQAADKLWHEYGVRANGR